MRVETNALAPGDAGAPPSDQALNDLPSDASETLKQEAPEAEAATAEAEGEAQSDDQSKQSEEKKRELSDRVRTALRERNEAEIRAHTAEQKTKAAQLEIRRLTRVLNEAGLTDAKRMAVEGRIEEKTLELEEQAENLEESRQEMKSTRFEIFAEKVGDESIVDKFCRLPRVSDALADLVAESDFAKELAAKLGNSPSEARRLSLLPDHRLGAEIARMERAFEKTPSVRRVSQAPEPSATLKGGSPRPAQAPGDMGVGDLQKMLRKSGVIR